jgi:hypothetical protein
VSRAASAGRPKCSVPIRFKRIQDGTITKFDVSGAGTGSGQGSFPVNINASGAIIGEYVDGNGVNHGFQRSARGHCAESLNQKPRTNRGFWSREQRLEIQPHTPLHLPRGAQRKHARTGSYTQ